MAVEYRDKDGNLVDSHEDAQTMLVCLDYDRNPAPKETATRGSISIRKKNGEWVTYQADLNRPKRVRE